MSEVTNTDLVMVRYFIAEKGDVTRWIDWEARKSAIRAKYPHLVDAIDRLDSANRTLKAIVDTLPEAP